MLRIATRFASPRFLRPAAASTPAFASPIRFGSLRAYSNALRADAEPLTHSASPIVKYTDNHEWIAAHDDGVAFIGITKYAADALGDATFVEVNDVPADVEVGDSLGSVESVKSASDVYAPVSGKLVERNEELIANPALLNEDPSGNAWLAKIEIAEAGELEDLLTLEQYQDSLEDH